MLPSEKYGNLALPRNLIRKIKKIVEEDDSLYTSMADFAKEAIREKIEKIKLLEKTLTQS